MTRINSESRRNKKIRKYNYKTIIIVFLLLLLAKNYIDALIGTPLTTILIAFIMLHLIFGIKNSLKVIRNLFQSVMGFIFRIIKNSLGYLPIIGGVLIIGLVVFMGYTLDQQQKELKKLTQKINIVEDKLGGTKRLSCSEKETIEKVKKSVVRIIGGEAEGSGFAIQQGGYILTNFHVIEFEPTPKVIFPDNTFETAEILMADKISDLAILKVEKDLPIISWGVPEELDPAEELLAIGFPMGGELSGEATVNKGSLAARRRSTDVGVEYLQTDITYTGGISGGPMVNICGEVQGINTAGLAGLGLAISTKSIIQKWFEMSDAEEPLKDIERITFDPDASSLETVRAFYNYLKARKLEKAFELLSDNYKSGISYSNWKKGYEPLLDTTVIKIEEDPEKKNKINIKLTTKDMVDGEIVYKYFEGYWEVREVVNQWQLWNPEIKEIKEPDYFWAYE